MKFRQHTVWLLLAVVIVGCGDSPYISETERKEEERERLAKMLAMVHSGVSLLSVRCKDFGNFETETVRRVTLTAIDDRRVETAIQSDCTVMGLLAGLPPPDEPGEAQIRYINQTCTVGFRLPGLTTDPTMQVDGELSFYYERSTYGFHVDTLHANLEGNIGVSDGTAHELCTYSSKLSPIR